MLPSRYKSTIVAVHDAVMAGASFVLALWLRWGDQFQPHHPSVWFGAVLFTGIAVTVFVSMRLYRGMWRYASVQDLMALTRAVTLAILIFIPAMFVFTRLEMLPRSLPFIHWMLLMLMLGAPRFAYRVWKDRSLEYIFRDHSSERIPVLLIGAGNGAELFLREMARRGESQYEVVGFVEDDPAKIGRTLQGVTIHGDVQGLRHVIDKLDRKGKKPRKIIVTTPRFTGEALTHMLQVAEETGVPLARLPSITEFKTGAVDTMELRPIAIEDLLGRAQATLDREAMAAFITGRTVLVTGAGGTIGGELTRQIASFAPKKLVLLEQSEFHLYSIDKELEERFPELSRVSRIADVRDTPHLTQIFADEAPDVVFHAAAIKHVPLSEANSAEAVLTNVFGTRNVAECCEKAGVRAMVMISTDKAVHPTNIMGASKRLAEMLCQWKGRESGKTRFITVRFGNVLGSTGSVVPLFRRQLEAGGPLTVTHPDMTRYFMTVREAVELVLQASALGGTGEAFKGPIFVLDMGEPVRIEDLARQMIRLAGYRPGEDIAIEYTGIRPGEKLYEELFYDDEAPESTVCDGVMLARPRAIDAVSMQSQLSHLHTAALTRDEKKVRTLMHTLVADYTIPA